MRNNLFSIYYFDAPDDDGDYVKHRWLTNKTWRKRKSRQRMRKNSKRRNRKQKRKYGNGDVRWWWVGEKRCGVV